MRNKVNHQLETVKENIINLSFSNVEMTLQECGN